LAVGGASENRLLRALLGKVAGDLAVLGKADKHVDILFLFVCDGTTSGGEDVNAESFRTLLFGVIPDIAESLLVIINIFCFCDGFS
jgi:hypothetical protein